MAKRTGLPSYPLLGRLATTHRIGLDRRSRLEQFAGAFYAIRGLEGQQVLLADNVVITGATLTACAEVLRGAGLVWAALAAAAIELVPQIGSSVGLERKPCARYSIQVQPTRRGTQVAEGAGLLNL